MTLPNPLLPPTFDEQNRHPAVASWFLGPRAENFKYLASAFLNVLYSQKKAREDLYPDDPKFITEGVQANALFQKSIDYMNLQVDILSQHLSVNSIPFWSPRYNGHMNMDTTMPALIGYLTTMLYNPNNVALEASPLTTIIETYVGKQLSEMLGYNTVPLPDSNVPVAWGHITADGSIANLESIWVARNLKFYPLSLLLAINEGDLKFVKNNPKPLIVTLCDGTKKKFVECSTWELLNLKPDTVMDLSKQLGDLYGVSQTALGAAMKPYLIQETGKDWLEKKFGIEKEAVMYIGTTAHYSWPKGGAIAGIGAANIIPIGIDLNARMNIKDLRAKLKKALDDKIAVYSVVAIMGSTEQGAVDPLQQIIELRTEFQEQGLSFLVHCDAAWGGYFATMLDRQPPKAPGFVGEPPTGFVPRQALNPYTVEQLSAYGEADSITIDPHKSGLCPYPAGGLCYRDGRLRFLVTWTSPIVFRSGDESIGVYGVEGSKPGAAPVGAWLSHEVIGLDKNGYGTLLGEGVFTCARLYANWVTLSTDDDMFIVTPFNMLPGEAEGKLPPKEMAQLKDFIRKHIVNVNNEALVKDPPALALLGRMGSDLMINALACNFKYRDGDKKITNTSIVEANIMNTRIFNRVSVARAGEKIGERELFLTSSQFAQKDYGECLDNYKKRIGLVGPDDLYSLVNVTMSPWPTDGSFLRDVVVAGFKKIVEEEAKYALARNTISPDLHGFVMQGDSPIHFVHLPMFNMKNHRYQLIITGDVPKDVLEKYKADKAANPKSFYTLGNAKPEVLEELLTHKEFDAVLDKGLPPDNGTHWITGFKLTNIQVVIKKSLELDDLKKEYPQISDKQRYPTRMPFYMYGTKEQTHIDHVLAWSPDVQLNSELVKCDFKDNKITDEQLKKGVICVFDGLDENIMQPIANDPGQKDSMTNWHTPALPFHRDQTFQVKVYPDYKSSQESDSPIATGSITLGASFADWDMTNDIPVTPGAHSMGVGSLAPGLASEHPIHGMYKELANRRRIEVAKEWTLGFAPLARRRELVAGSLKYMDMKPEASFLAGYGEEKKQVTLDDF